MGLITKNVDIWEPKLGSSNGLDDNLVVISASAGICRRISAFHRFVGIIFFAGGVSGYSGLKYVIHYDLVGGKYMQYIIAYGKFHIDSCLDFKGFVLRYRIGCPNINCGPISCLCPF